MAQRPRLAMLVAGHMRWHPEECHRLNVANVVSQFDWDCDVFVVTYRTLENPRDTGVDFPDRIADERIAACYGPALKRLRVYEDSREATVAFRETSGKRYGYNRHLMTRMKTIFAQVDRCFRMAMDHARENGFRYDFVMRTRPDIAFTKPMALPSAENAADARDPAARIAQGVVYANPFKWSDSCPSGSVIVGDQLAIGRTDAMRHYCSVVNHHEEIDREGLVDMDVMEAILSRHLDRCGVYKVPMWSWSWATMRRKGAASPGSALAHDGRSRNGSAARRHDVALWALGSIAVVSTVSAATALALFLAERRRRGPRTRDP
jgi:hypothetical protein